MTPLTPLTLLRFFGRAGRGVRRLTQIGGDDITSKRLVLIRPPVAGFHRPLTLPYRRPPSRLWPRGRAACALGFPDSSHNESLRDTRPSACAP
jgi:hypothetical protein